MLAVVAAIERIGAVVGPLELVRLDDLVAQIESARHRQRELTMVIGITGTVGREAERTIASEDIRRRPREVSTVDAATEGDDNRI